MAKTKDSVKDRVDAIFRWCKAKWPTPYPVRLRWAKSITTKSSDGEPEIYLAITERVGRHLVITMSEKYLLRDRSRAIDIVLHEYAHCRDWRNERLESDAERKHHGPEWGLYYAELYDAFIDGPGDGEARRLVDRAHPRAACH